MPLVCVPWPRTASQPPSLHCVFLPIPTGSMISLSYSLFPVHQIKVVVHFSRTCISSSLRLASVTCSSLGPWGSRGGPGCWGLCCPRASVQGPGPATPTLPSQGPPAWTEAGRCRPGLTGLPNPPGARLLPPPAHGCQRPPTTHSPGQARLLRAAWWAHSHTAWTCVCARDLVGGCGHVPAGGSEEAPKLPVGLPQ